MDDSRNKRQTWLICLGLALAILAAYSPLWRCGFVLFDDNDYVTSNEMVKRGITWPGIVWAFSSFGASNWHPLTWISHMLDCQLYGLNPVGHHLTSLLLHIANSILLFFLLRRLTKSQWPSAIVAGLFALHPLHVESVAWISERKDVLSTLFWILSVWAYAEYAPKHGRLFYLCSVALFVLGLMAKPMLVTLPFVLLLLDIWPLQRLRRPFLPLLAEKIPFFLLAAASCVMTVLAQGWGGAMESLEVERMGLRLENVPVAYVRYLQKTFVPINLAAYYPFHEWPVWEVAGATLLLGFITAWVIRRVRTQPYILVGWLWFVGMLIPVIGLVHVGAQAMADRYHYLPSVGLFILIVWAVREKAPAIWAWLALGACAAVTWIQVHYWTGSEALFRRAVTVTERNSVMENDLGKVLLLQERVDDALPHLQRAVEFEPRFPLPHLNLGRAFMAKGKVADALSQFEIQVSLTPNDAMARYNFGNALLDAGLPGDAAPQLEKAIELRPDAADFHCKLGDACRQAGRAAGAISQYEKALQLFPNYLQAASSLAWMLATSPNASLRNGARAVQVAQVAARLSNGKDPRTAGVLAAAYAEAGDFPKATLAAEGAVKMAEASDQSALAGALRKQLESYQAGRPYRDKP